jgi:hypothetical protein
LVQLRFCPERFSGSTPLLLCTLQEDGKHRSSSGHHHKHSSHHHGHGDKGGGKAGGAKAELDPDADAGAAFLAGAAALEQRLRRGTPFLATIRFKNDLPPVRHKI